MTRRSAVLALIVLATGASSASAALNFRGLCHSPEGAATITLLPGDRLGVRINASGDGVSIDTTQAALWTGSFEPLDASAAPTGAFVETTAIGVVTGPIVPLANVQMQDNGANLLLLADFIFLGSPARNVQLFNGDTLVASASGLTGALATLASVDHMLELLSVEGGVPVITIRLGAPTVVTLTGQPPAIGNRIVIASAAAGTFQSVRRIEALAGGFDSFVITDETIGKFGGRHRGLGQATIEAAGAGPTCTLTLANVGPSGLDGVESEYEPADGIDLAWEPITQTTPGAFEIAVRGTVSGIPGAPVGDIGIEQTAGGTIIRADFSGLGSLSRRVEYYENGSLLAVHTGITTQEIAFGPLGQWPIATTARAPDFSNGMDGFRTYWAFPVVFQPVTGPPVLADEIRVYGENPTSTTNSLAAASTHQESIPETVFGDLAPDPICPGDVDGDNQVDLCDLSVLLGNFGTLEGATRSDGDLDGDHDVDITDLSTLLSVFGTSC